MLVWVDLPKVVVLGTCTTNVPGSRTYSVLLWYRLYCLTAMLSVHDLDTFDRTLCHVRSNLILCSVSLNT